MENRKEIDTKQGSWKQTQVKGKQGLEFQFGVAQSVTFSLCAAPLESSCPGF